MSLRRFTLTSLLVSSLALLAAPASAQYFGRNKVQYRKFDFQVMKTDHFDIYYYEAEREAAEEAGRMAERWHAKISRVLGHELNGRQPLILYASHPDFEQTNAISGELGESTGGVTESFKRRIVLPFAGTLAESDHVLGHELVHAFQFDVQRQGRSSGALGATSVYLPLWFVEGMAEYLSVGAHDPHTAMWLRDAAQSNKLPSFSKLNDPSYFPYRFGQAFWAYVCGRYGEDVVADLLKMSVRGGETGTMFRRRFEMSPDSLAMEWQQAIRDWNAPIAAVSDGASNAGRPIIVPGKNRGRINLAPALSPDGKRLMFLSERDMVSIELYLADAESGKILKKVTQAAVDPHLQSLQFIGSAGAFSPEGSRFAFAVVLNGVAALRVINVANGRTIREVKFPDLGEVLTPTWAPDGRQVAFSALVGGATDLFVVDTITGETRRLTHDLYADLFPAWSPDGSSIAYVTDRFGTDLKELTYGTEQLALIDPSTLVSTPVEGGGLGKNINPQWSPDGKDLYFVSDREGISDLYRVPSAGGEALRLTKLLTGVSGITRLSPAITVARETGRLVFSAYERGSYGLYALDQPATMPGLASRGFEPQALAQLPPPQRKEVQLASVSPDSLRVPDSGGFTRKPYRPGLSLDFVSQIAIGVSGGGGSGVAVSGGTALYWSDMLGNHNLLTALQASNLSGNVMNDVAGIVAYQNLASRWNWSLALAQLPYLSRRIVIDEGVFSGEPGVRVRDIMQWQVDRELVGTISRPFNRVHRLEMTGGYRGIAFRQEIESIIYPDDGGLPFETTTEAEFPSLHLATTGMALVYDTSIYGATSPLMGQSYRFECAPIFGDLQYTEALIDYRRYIPLVRPFTLAARAVHFGRYGPNGEDLRLPELYLGSPYLIRGYDEESFTAAECSYDPSNPGLCDEFERLFGSRLAVGNVELRLPLIGPGGVVPAMGFPPVEIAGFYDTGVAWTKGNSPRYLGGVRDWVSSYGGALRFNLFGLAIGEFAAVMPEDRPRKGWYWQFSLKPGF